MAYMNQEKKAKIAAQLKKVVPAGWKYTLAVENHSGIRMTISAAPVDLIESIRESIVANSREPNVRRLDSGTYEFNPYWYKSQLEGHPNLKDFEAIFAALNIDNYNRSDIQSDYFDVGHYVYLTVGKYNKPFVCTALKEAA